MMFSGDANMHSRSNMVVLCVELICQGVMTVRTYVMIMFVTMYMVTVHHHEMAVRDQIA